jgi:hypothetical protein
MNVGLNKTKFRFESPSSGASVPFRFPHKSYPVLAGEMYDSPAQILLKPAANLRTTYELLKLSFNGDIIRAHEMKAADNELFDEVNIGYLTSVNEFRKCMELLSQHPEHYTRVAVAFFSSEGQENVPALLLIPLNTPYVGAKRDAIEALDRVFTARWYDLAKDHVLDEKNRRFIVNPDANHDQLIDFLQLLNMLRPLSWKITKNNSAFVISHAKSLLEMLEGFKFIGSEGQTLFTLSFPGILPDVQTHFLHFQA